MSTCSSPTNTAIGRRMRPTFLKPGSSSTRGFSVLHSRGGHRDSRWRPAYNDGHPPAIIRFAGKDIPNPANKPAPSMLGAAQKTWFSGGTEGLPARRGRSGAIRSRRLRGAPIRKTCQRGSPPWGGAGYATFGGSDWSTMITERAEIFDAIRKPASPASPSSPAIVTRSGRGCHLRHCRRDHLIPSVWNSSSARSRPRASSRRRNTSCPRTRRCERCISRSVRCHETRGDPQHARAAWGTRGTGVWAFRGPSEGASALKSGFVTASFICGSRWTRLRDRAGDTGCARDRVRVYSASRRAEYRAGWRAAVIRVSHRARLWKRGERPSMEQRILEGIACAFDLTSRRSAATR